jgi:hypothetical protein
MGTVNRGRTKDVPANRARIIRQAIVTVGAIAVVAIPGWLSQRGGARDVQAPLGAGESSLLPGGNSGQAGTARARRQAIPFVVRERYTPSGSVGDAGHGPTYVTVAHTNAEVNGRPALAVRVTYAPGDSGWAGVYWQHPANNWASAPGLNLTGAREVAFLARGEAGGEIVEFKAGGIVGGPYPDSFEASLGSVPLAKEWHSYRIDLARENLSNVVGAFAWVASAADNGNRPITFYLADLQVK